MFKKKTPKDIMRSNLVANAKNLLDKFEKSGNSQFLTMVKKTLDQMYEYVKRGED